MSQWSLLLQIPHPKHETAIQIYLCNKDCQLEHWKFHSAGQHAAYLICNSKFTFPDSDVIDEHNRVNFHPSLLQGNFTLNQKCGCSSAIQSAAELINGLHCFVSTTSICCQSMSQTCCLFFRQAVVSWTTANRTANPIVLYGTTSGNYTQNVTASYDNYTRSDMCGAIANSTGWTDPGKRLALVKPRCNYLNAVRFLHSTSEIYKGVG